MPPLLQSISIQPNSLHPFSNIENAVEIYQNSFMVLLFRSSSQWRSKAWRLAFRHSKISGLVVYEQSYSTFTIEH